MGNQTFERIKKTIAILMVIFFVVTLTAASASARDGRIWGHGDRDDWGHGGWDHGWRHGDWDDWRHGGWDHGWRHGGW